MHLETAGHKYTARAPAPAYTYLFELAELVPVTLVFFFHDRHACAELAGCLALLENLGQHCLATRVHMRECLCARALVSAAAGRNVATERDVYTVHSNTQTIVQKSRQKQKHTRNHDKSKSTGVPA